MREQDLRRFVKEAGHASDADALGRLLVAALDRYTQNAGCTIYRRQDTNGWRRTEGTLAEAPDLVDDNHETMLALRAHDKALQVRAGADALSAAWAFPMSQRGKLVGFMLLGPLRNGDSYRPDQIEAIEAAVHKVGIDFHALRIEGLESELAEERVDVRMLRAQLATAMALRTTE